MRFFRVSILILFLAVACKVSGQLPDGSILNKRISLKIQDRSIASVLDLISEEAGIYFSYDATLIDSEKKISLKAINKTISEILAEIIGNDDFRFNELNNHIIINIKEPESSPVVSQIPDSAKSGFIRFAGKVTDRKSHEPIQYANISLVNKPIGTISNTDGDYVLKLNEKFRNDTVAFSCLGYATKKVRLNNSGIMDLIELDPISVKIKEVKVTAITPDEILKKIIENIPVNYPAESILMTSFYRETIKQDDNYINVSEAVMEILKSPYTNDLRDDKVRMIKGRKSPGVKTFKWINFKLQGGPYTITKLDIVKTNETFLNQEFRSYYKYDIRDVIWFKSHPAFVLRFKPYKTIGFPCFSGELIVDRESFAIMHASFTYGRPALNLVGKSMIRKKPNGVSVRPVSVEYIVDYSLYDGKWFLNTASSSVEFRVRSQEDQVNTSYSSLSELLVTDLKRSNLRRFPKDEEFTFKDIFSETISGYDENFWENYNIIKPDEDLKNAIKNFRINQEQPSGSSATHK